jgi:UDP-N-acetylglucosamine--N-acetylmuramyl-(pentapeptide) pyrophosphoryl-undecaprenol N-acetylglucosamine transferase
MAHIVMMAGGTGGHVFPALAAAKELMCRGHTVSWLGSPDSFETRHVPQHEIEIDTVNIKGLRGNGIRRLLGAPLLLTQSTLQALSVLRKRKPALVVGMGGFASGPGGVAAKLLGIPLVIHEQNAIAGMTNRLLSRIAKAVCEAFPDTFPKSTKRHTVGNPVRADILSLGEPLERYSERTGPLQMLVVGGSLGAQALNEMVPLALAKLPGEQRPKVGHQAGRGKDAATREHYASAGVEAWVVEFIDDMAEAYAWADLVVCRSGALTVSELAAAGVAALLVPYPYAVDDHQSANGNYLAKGGAAIMIQQRDLDPERLASELKALDRETVTRMAVTARSLAKPDATGRFADICEEVLAA